MKRFFVGVCTIGLFAVGHSVCMQAQPNTPERREFEVASVRQFQGPHVPHGVSLSVSHGRVSVDAGSLRQLVALAYGIQRALVEGGPDWCDRDEFNVVAKAENEGASNAEVQVMLQTLLADRFKLGIHIETKDLPGYVLVQVRNRSNLKPAKDEEVTSFKAVMNGLTFQKMPIAGLASYLANLAGAPVQDLTGLTELYNFSLDLTLRPSTQPELQDGNARSVVDRFGRVSTAVEEQLGLRVEARKVSAEVMVIQHAEHPSEN